MKIIHHLLYKILKRKQVAKLLSALLFKKEKRKKFHSKINSFLYNYKVLNRADFIPSILSPTDAIKKIVSSNKSVSRFGDGELGLINGSKGISFQDNSPELTQRLSEILQSNEEQVLIGIPYMFWNSSQLHEYARNSIHKYMVKNVDNLLKKIDAEKVYIDTGFTQVYSTLKEVDYASYFNLVKKIWDKKDITIICGDKIFDKLSVNIFDSANSTEYLYAPTKNAFSQYNTILEQAKKLDKNRLIIIILGLQQPY